MIQKIFTLLKEADYMEANPENQHAIIYYSDRTLCIPLAFRSDILSTFFSEIFKGIELYTYTEESSFTTLVNHECILYYSNGDILIKIRNVDNDSEIYKTTYSKLIDKLYFFYKTDIYEETRDEYEIYKEQAIELLKKEGKSEVTKIKNLNDLSNPGINKKKAKKNNEKKVPKSLKEIFLEPEKAINYINILKELTSPILNDENGFCGSYKAGLVIWFDLLRKKVKYYDDKTYSLLIRNEFDMDSFSDSNFQKISIRAEKLYKFEIEEKVKEVEQK
jgi:hypothetical protein